MMHSVIIENPCQLAVIFDRENTTNMVNVCLDVRSNFWILYVNSS